MEIPRNRREHSLSSSIKVDFALLCDHAFFDQYQRLCLAGIIHGIGLPRVPMSVRDLVLAVRGVSASPGTVETRLRITQPDGNPAMNAESGGVQLDVKGDHLIATIRELQLPTEGIYTFEVLMNGTSVVTVPIGVKVVGAPPGIH